MEKLQILIGDALETEDILGISFLWKDLIKCEGLQAGFDLLRALYQTKVDDEQKHCLLLSTLKIIERHDLLETLSDHLLYMSRESHVSTFKKFACIFHIKEDSRKLFHAIREFDCCKDTEIKVYKGAGTNDFVKRSKWHEESQKYFNRFFPDGVHDVISIPPSGGEIIETMKLWCGMEYGEGLIVKNYDIMRHFKFLGVEDHEINKVINPKYGVSSQENVFVLNFKEGVIFMIHEVSASKGAGDANEELRSCIANVKLLITLYQNELESSGFRVIGLCVTDRSDVGEWKLDCNLCKIFLVERGVFSNVEFFQMWWEENERWFFIEDIGDINRDSFLLFISKLLTFLASTKCPYLPNLTDDPASQIKQTLLILTPEQLHILHSLKKHLIIMGDYGVGKSMVALKKLEQIAAQLKEGDMCYVVNYDSKSCYTVDMEKDLRTFCPANYDKIRIKRNLGNLKLSEIFDSVLREVDDSIKSIHMIFDEFKGEDMSKSEVKSLKHYLQQDNRFKNSVVWILVQSIMKERVDYHSIENVYESHKSDANMFFELEDVMTKEKLTYVMRTSVQINRLAEVTREYLRDKQNKYIYSDNTAFEDTFELESADKFLPVCGFDNRVTFMKLEENEKEELQKLDAGNNMSSSDDFSNGQNEVEQKQSPAHTSFPSDLDDAYKQVHEEASPSTGNQLTETKYIFMEDSTIGHNIKTDLPRLFKPFQFEDEFDNIMSFRAVLEVLGIEKKKTVILHFEREVPSILLNTLKFISTKVEFDVEKFKKGKRSKCLLISNYNYVRGMECENIIILLDPDEYCLKHHIPECITRCTKNLAIVLLPDRQLRSEEDTVKGIIRDWENKDVVLKYVVDLKDESQKNSRYCSRGDEGEIIINVNSKEYKSLKQGYKPPHSDDWNEDSDKVNAKKFVKMHRESSKLHLQSQLSLESNPDHDINNVTFKWTQKKLLGEGEFADAYICCHEEEKKDIVVKHISKERLRKFFNREPDNFSQKIEQFKELNHENIVKFYGGIHNNEDITSLFLELMPAGSIRNLIAENGALSEEDTKKFCKQVLHGLIYLHENDIIHRDIKASNVFLDRNKNCKLMLNFYGIGSAYWMSPEVMKGFKNCIKKSDIWSLGCFVVEMRNTVPPWFELSIKEAVKSIAWKETKANLAKGTSTDCVKFVEDCFQREISKRPSADELLQYNFMQSKLTNNTRK